MLTVTSPQDVQPKLAKIPLKPHQLAMLKRCKDIEAKNKGLGIMKDPPGSGKTYVILSLILQEIEGKDSLKTTNIVVVPQNIYTQWIKAITTFSENIRYSKYIDYADVSSLYFNPSFDGVNVILTTPLYFNIIQDALDASNVQVNRIIIDEIDSIEFLCKGYLSKKTAKTLWLVSASFDRYKHFLLTTFDDRITDLEGISCQSSADFVATGFPLPPYNQKDILCASSYLDNILYGVLTSSEMQAANAFDYSKIEKKHITMVATNEKEALEFLMKDLMAIIDCEERQIEHYDELLKDRVDEVIKTARDTSRKNLEKSRHRLKIISDRLNESNMCLICYDEFDNTPKVVTFCCQNSFCQSCIRMWYVNANKCPYCRAVNTYGDHVLIHANNNATTIPTWPRPAPSQNMNKLDTLENLLLTEVGSKVIIFSDYSNIFAEISKKLKTLNIEYIELDGGSIGAIDQEIHSYKQGDARVLMCNSRSFGCGMNLENTTDIIFIHKTEESMYKQVIGRAQRAGRTSPLNVYRLLHSNEQICSSSGVSIEMVRYFP